MQENRNALNTGAVDLFSPADRFVSASRLHGSFHRWWLHFRRFWWVPALIVPAVVVPVCRFSVLQGPSYESRARLWVTGKINVSESWSYTEELVNFLGTQAALVESPAIQNRAMARLRAETGANYAGLAVTNHPSSWAATKTFFQKMIGFNVVTDPSAPPPLPFLVKVQEGAKSSTLDIRVIGPEPAYTRKFLDCLLAEYLSFKKESRDQTSTQASSSLSAEIARVKGELTEAQDKLQAFQASNNVALLQHQGSGAESYLAALNRQLAVLRTEQKLLDSLHPEQWAQATALRADAVPASSDEATARQLLASLAHSQSSLFQADQQMHLLMSQRDQLSRFLRPEHPKIIKLNQDIAIQQQLVQLAGEEASKQLTLRRQAVQAQIENLETASQEWNSNAIVAGRKVAEYEQLQQNAQRLQAACDKTLGLMQNLDVANRVETENVGILDAASAARPTHRLLLNLAVALALAMFLCFGVFYVTALFRDDFASGTELAAQLAFPVLGQIPSIPLKPENGAQALQGFEKQRFEFLEAFRSIRASLLFMNNGGGRPKTIVITSSVPGEGKSTIALYLAATLARGQSRVLLVDADMRRPGLHQHFGLPNGPGLAELLNRELTSVQLTFPNGANNLALLRAGVAKRDPGDLVFGPLWDEFLTTVKSRFDFVLVDTPPVAATDDAATMAPSVDGVLFVVRALSTSARAARGVLEVLRQRHARVLGLVFNAAVSSPSERQYYEQYASAYRWQSERGTTPKRTRGLTVGVTETQKVASGAT